MILNRQLFEDTDYNFHVLFNKGLNQYRESDYLKELVLTVPSRGRSERYVWANAFPRMKEWVSDAQFQRLQGYGFTLENKYWQEGIEVLREDIEDDQLNIVAAQIDNLSEAAAMQPSDLIYDLLVGGFAGTLGRSYDGQYFFDTDHQDGNGPILSNKGTAPFSEAAFIAALRQMRTLRDESSRILTFKPTLLVVGPALEDAARRMVESEYTATGETNIYRNSVRLVVINRLDEHPTFWFLFDTSKSIKPFVFQERQATQFAAQDKPADNENFMRRILRWSAWQRNNAGYAMWQMAYGSTGGGV
jgi:phage major head subunit gpT-like protein